MKLRDPDYDIYEMKNLLSEGAMRQYANSKKHLKSSDKQRRSQRKQRHQWLQ